MKHEPLVADSVTHLDAAAAGRVVIAGSHCGVYAAHLAARAGVRAIVLNDAAVGKDGAGIGGLSWLARLSIPAAAVGFDSARIGDGNDCLRRGVITYVNDVAAALGCRKGQTAGECVAMMSDRAPAIRSAAPDEIEGRYRIDECAPRAIEVWAIDSISLLRANDAGAIVLSGSHGGLLGGLPETALAFDAAAAVFNDAGGGIDGAGFTRLTALDQRGIAAATVDAFSARIGDGRSTFETGIVSRVNRTALQLGTTAGITTRAFVHRIGCALRERKTGRTI